MYIDASSMGVGGGEVRLKASNLESTAGIITEPNNSFHLVRSRPFGRVQIDLTCTTVRVEG